VPFTEWRAWEFVVELLESGCPIEEIPLRNPPGKKGYVLKHSMPEVCETLYVKLQLGSGCVIARSFHYSIRSGTANDENDE
jgi:hypothetical protein